MRFDRRAVEILLEQLDSILHRLGPELIRIPQIAIKLEEPTWFTVGAFRVADEKLHVEMPDDLHLMLVKLPVEILEKVAAFFQSPHRKMRRISAILRRVREAPEVC